MTNYNASDLINKLAEHNLVVGNLNAVKQFTLAQQQSKELPIYLRCLIGVGAFIASFCFIAFLAIADIIDFSNDIALIVWGVIFVIIAIGLLTIAGDDHSVKHSFFLQSSFVAMAVGKALFVTGVAQLINSSWGVPLATLIVTIITYPIYRVSIDRFLSGFVVLFSVVVNVLWDRDIVGYREVLFNSFIFIQLVIAAFLFCYGKTKRYFIPLAYSFAFSLICCVLFISADSEFGSWGHKEFIESYMASYMLAISLIVSIGWAAGNFSKLKSLPLLLASVIAILLGAFSAPGVILAIVLMLLGYAKHESLLITMGALLLPACLVLYYYNLDISLMEKAAVLVISGLLLLVGRFYLSFKGWDRGHF